MTSSLFPAPYTPNAGRVMINARASAEIASLAVPA